MEKHSTSPSAEPRAFKIAERIDRLSMEGAFAVFAKARALEARGKKIIHLEIGEPDFQTPKNIRDAAIASLEAGETHYTPAAGLPELREAVARHVSKMRGIAVAPEEVVITPGAKHVIFCALTATIEEGDEVILPTPGYPTYESVVRFLKAVPVFLELEESEDFRFDIRQLEKKITPKTRMIILNSPHNPTGGMLTGEDLEKTARLAEKHDLLVLSDEIYGRIVYGVNSSSFFSQKEVKSRGILVDGFSKTYAMTGWRLGYGVMPKPLADAVIKILNNSNACTCTFVQKAGIEALQGPQQEVSNMVSEFQKRRDAIVEGLNQIAGFSCRTPKGAFYAYPNITKTGMKSQALADMLLEKAGVAVTAGTAFGAHGEGYLRFSYANSIENIRNAVAKIKDAIK